MSAPVKIMVEVDALESLLDYYEDNRVEYPRAEIEKFWRRLCEEIEAARKAR